MNERRTDNDQQERTTLLRELLAGHHYVVEDSAVAEAILTRVRARSLIPGVLMGGAPAHPLDGARRRSRAPHVARPARGIPTR